MSEPHYHLTMMLDRFNCASDLHGAIRILRRVYRESKDDREKLGIALAIQSLAKEQENYIGLGMEEYDSYQKAKNANS